MEGGRGADVGSEAEEEEAKEDDFDKEAEDENEVFGIKVAEVKL